MTREEFQKGLTEISPDTSGKISREELYKMLTTAGEKFSASEANQALSLIPKEDGWICVEEFSKILFSATADPEKISAE